MIKLKMGGLMIERKVKLIGDCYIVISETFKADYMSLNVCKQMIEYNNELFETYVKSILGICEKLELKPIKTYETKVKFENFAVVFSREMKMKHDKKLALISELLERKIKVELES
jgi:hypothetical protein